MISSDEIMELVDIEAIRNAMIFIRHTERDEDAEYAANIIIDTILAMKDMITLQKELS